MIPLAWEELVAVDLGVLRGAPADGIIRAVHDDSRVAGPGDLFVALNTGTRFVEDALAAGASTLVPRDQNAALAALASLVRSRSDTRVVAVVGSTGKTSTKDALAALCAAVTPTVAAEASRNNELGLPLTVLRLEPETRVLVTEMGMRGPGQIAELCAIAKPDVTVVTSIGPEHLELVGTVADVARANAEAIEALPAGGIAVVPSDAPELDPFLGRSDIDIRRFERAAVVRVDSASNSLLLAGSTPPAGGTAGVEDEAGVSGEGVSGSRSRLPPGDLTPPTEARTAATGAEGTVSRWRFEVPGGPDDAVALLELELPFDQRHMAENVLAALTVYRALGLPLERAQEGAASIRLSRWRAEVHELEGGGVVVNDAYNANPTSMRAALLDLVERAAGRRRVVILGEMAELGAESSRYHADVADLIRELGIEVVVGVGEPARTYLDAASESHWLAGADEAERVLEVVRPGDAVLVKASRAVGLEGIAGLIEKRVGSWSAS